MLCNVHNRYFFSISDKTTMAEKRIHTIVSKQFSIRVAYYNLSARKEGEKEQEKKNHRVTLSTPLSVELPLLIQTSGTCYLIIVTPIKDRKSVV